MARQTYQQIAEIVGANLRAARLIKGCTQRQVADAVGVTPADVSRWERGQVEPGSSYRQALAEYLLDGDLASLYRELAEAEQEAATP